MKLLQYIQILGRVVKFTILLGLYLPQLLFSISLKLLIASWWYKEAVAGDWPLPAVLCWDRKAFAGNAGGIGCAIRNQEKWALFSTLLDEWFRTTFLPTPCHGACLWLCVKWLYLLLVLCMSVHQGLCWKGLEKGKIYVIFSSCHCSRTGLREGLL